MEKIRTNIFPSAMVESQGQIYMADLYSNAVFRYDLDNNKVNIVTQFNGEPSVAKELYTDIIYCNNKLYFIPHRAKKLAILDLRSNSVFEEKLPRGIISGNGEYKSAVSCNGNIFILGYCAKNILCYNDETGFYDEINFPESPGLFTSGLMFENSIYIVSKVSTDVWMINGQDNRVSVIHTRINEKGLLDIKRVGQDIILVAIDSHNIYKLKENGKVEKTLTPTKGTKKTDWPYGVGAVDDYGRYYLVTSNDLNIISIDEKEVACRQEDNFKNKHIDAQCGKVIKARNIIFWFYNCNMIYEYNPQSEIGEWKELLLDGYMNQKFDKEFDYGVIEETKAWKLQNFIRALQ